MDFGTRGLTNFFIFRGLEDTERGDREAWTNVRKLISNPEKSGSLSMAQLVDLGNSIHFLPAVSFDELDEPISGHKLVEDMQQNLAAFESVLSPNPPKDVLAGQPAEETSGCSSESGIMVLKQKTGPRKGAPDRCYHSNQPDRIQIAFDDHRLVANAGLILPATLALRLGLPQLLRKHLDLGGAPGRANTGDKMMTLVASALAGGDCIDDADVLRAGGTARVLGFTAKAPSTLGTFLRSFRWGHVRQLDRVSRELLARVWQAGAGPGDAPFTIDLDSTICETYGLAKEGARHHGYTGARGYHPLLAIAAGTGDVLMSRLREGRANTARGAAHFLRETVGRVRYCGARGQLTMRADSGFYTHAVVAVCRRMDVRFSIAIRQRVQPAESHRGDTRRCLDADSLLDGRRRRCGRDHLHPVPGRAGRRAGTAHRPAGEAGARFSTGSLRHLQLSRLHHRPGRGDAGTGG